MDIPRAISEVTKEFFYSTDVEQVTRISGGHLHDTFHVTLSQGEFILQRIARSIEPSAERMMENALTIQQVVNPTGLSYLCSREHSVHLFRDSENRLWRVSGYLPAKEMKRAENALDARKVGAAFGEFLADLWELPVDSMVETIPHFHDTKRYFERLSQAIEKKGAIDQAVNNVWERLQKLKPIALRLSEMELPMRITHNDVKCTNVLFLELDGRAAVIDWDTVMPGLLAYDFGDGIRSVGMTYEGDRRLPKLDEVKANAFTDGFLSPITEKLTDKERASLLLGPVTVTTELAVRYLLDYVTEGGHFQESHAGENLERAEFYTDYAENLARYTMEWLGEEGHAFT